MKTIVCKHEVHQVHQEDAARYELALSVIRSLIANIDEGSNQIILSAKPDIPTSDFFRNMGGLDAYKAIEGKLHQWEIMICMQAGIPLPSFEEEVAECC